MKHKLIRGDEWTEAEDEIVIKCFRLGMLDREIAEHVPSRTMDGVRWRRSALGLAIAMRPPRSPELPPYARPYVMTAKAPKTAKPKPKPKTRLVLMYVSSEGGKHDPRRIPSESIDVTTGRFRFCKAIESEMKTV